MTFVNCNETGSASASPKIFVFILSFLNPGVKPLAEFVPVCGVDEVVEGRGLALEVEGLRVAVFRHLGEFYALSGRCPHENGPLGHGWIEEGEAICPLHRWRFKLTTGRCTTTPGASLHRFACEVREGKVWVAV